MHAGALNKTASTHSLSADFSLPGWFQAGTVAGGLSSAERSSIVTSASTYRRPEAGGQGRKANLPRMEIKYMESRGNGRRG